MSILDKFVQVDWKAALTAVPSDVVKAIQEAHYKAILPKLKEQDRWLDESRAQAHKDLACSGCRD